LVVDAPPFF